MGDDRGETLRSFAQQGLGGSHAANPLLVPLPRQAANPGVVSTATKVDMDLGGHRTVSLRRFAVATNSGSPGATTAVAPAAATALATAVIALATAATALATAVPALATAVTALVTAVTASATAVIALGTAATAPPQQ